jgi:hypothetical protein
MRAPAVSREQVAVSHEPALGASHSGLAQRSQLTAQRLELGLALPIAKVATRTTMFDPVVESIGSLL